MATNIPKTTSIPYITVLPNKTELYDSSLKNSFEQFEQHGGTKLEFVKETKFYVGKCYTLNEIMRQPLLPPKKRRRLLPPPESRNRLMKKLKKFNLSLSLTSNLNDKIYYLTAWIKGLIRKRQVYDSSLTKDWNLLPLYNKEFKDWALLAWNKKNDDGDRPILYTTSDTTSVKRFLTYECVTDSAITITSEFYDTYHPIVKQYPSSRKLFKIMQLAYNLFADNSLSRETDVEYLFTLIAFEEPYFDGYIDERQLEDDTCNKQILTLSRFDQLLKRINKGDDRTLISCNKEAPW